MSWVDSQLENIKAATDNVTRYATEIGGVAQSVSNAYNQVRTTAGAVKSTSVGGVLATFGDSAKKTGDAAQATKYVMYAVLIGGAIAIVYFLRKR